MIELVVVIAILATLVAILAPRVSNQLAAARDARRLADIQTVRLAIERYYQDNGVYPRRTGTNGRWDRSNNDQGFLRVLRDEGYLDQEVRDPINDRAFHYRYRVYNQGSHGCVGPGKFYVLGIRNFETPEFAARDRGFFACSGKDWGETFAFVTGGGASLE